MYIAHNIAIHLTCKEFFITGVILLLSESQCITTVPYTFYLHEGKFTFRLLVDSVQGMDTSLATLKSSITSRNHARKA